MTAAELIQHVGNLGFRLEPRSGGGLAVRPASKLPADLADELRHYKTDIIRLLATSMVTFPNSASPEGPLCKGWGAVPPRDLPLVALKPNPTTAQRELVIAYQARQCGNPQLREWLTRRKSAYYTTIGKTWDCGLLAYAAARDAACWQLDRTEAEVWALLEGIESCVLDIKFNR